jgi:uncharacterized surface protein with fasciclin (FAS1) repeats
VRKTQRLAAVSAMGALTVALSACGGGADEPATGTAGDTANTAGTAAPTTTGGAAATTGAADTGVTTAEDVFGPACDQLPQGDEPGSLAGMGPMPVASAVGTNPLLSTLVTAIGKVPGLADTLDQQEAITVYAPSNEAFAAVKEQMGEEQFNALLADPGQLQLVLSYHVVGQRYDAEGLVEAGTTTQLAGGTVSIGGDADAPTFMGDGNAEPAHTLCGNIPTANATVFVIDKVLLPATE